MAIPGWESPVLGEGSGEFKQGLTALQGLGRFTGSAQFEEGLQEQEEREGAVYQLGFAYGTLVGRHRGFGLDTRD
jgi:hypothetical protein